MLRSSQGRWPNKPQTKGFNFPSHGQMQSMAKFMPLC